MVKRVWCFVFACSAHAVPSIWRQQMVQNSNSESVSEVGKNLTASGTFVRKRQERQEIAPAGNGEKEPRTNLLNQTVQHGKEPPNFQKMGWSFTSETRLRVKRWHGTAQNHHHGLLGCICHRNVLIPPQRKAVNATPITSRTPRTLENSNEMLSNPPLF